MLKQAEIEKRKIETLAEAEKQRLTIRGRRPRRRDARDRRGRSRHHLQEGRRRSQAMNVKAEAYQEWNQAAVVDKLLTGLPEVVRALAAPLANMDKITIVSTGDGNSAGMHKITGDIDANGGPDPGAVRDALGHADVRPAREGQADRRQAAVRSGRARASRRKGGTLMALLERVATLIRANLNDLIDKAEDPEKMIKQVILDMQNQLLQVKTQVAIAIADQHVLEKKQKENEEKHAEWTRKAELAVDKEQDDLARAALERAVNYKHMQENFAQQMADQKAQVEKLKSALRKLEQKLAEAKSKSDLLIAQHRRARALSKASDARLAMADGSGAAAFDRMQKKSSTAKR